MNQDGIVVVIINTLPVSKGLFTRFMNPGNSRGSNSILDYGLIDGDNVNSVSSFVIDERARFRCGSDHALLECEMKFTNQPRLRWTYNEVISYNINDNTSFRRYEDLLDENIGSMNLAQFSLQSPAAMLPHLINTLHSSAKLAIGNAFLLI